RDTAKGAVRPDEPGGNPLEIRKSRPPHQRAVGENPQVIVIVLDGLDHCRSCVLEFSWRCMAVRGLARSGRRVKLWPNFAPVQNSCIFEMPRRETTKGSMSGKPPSAYTLPLYPPLPPPPTPHT